jgi:hypothetical protein
VTKDCKSNWHGAAEGFFIGLGIIVLILICAGMIFLGGK